MPFLESGSIERTCPQHHAEHVVGTDVSGVSTGGFGPAAYSDFAGERFGYSRDVDAYIAGEEILLEREKPSPMERIHEYVMLRMRLGEGIVTSVFEERFDCSFDALFGSAIEPFVQKGLVLHSENGYRFTAEGMLLSNAVLSELLDFSGDAAKAKKNT